MLLLLLLLLLLSLLLLMLLVICSRTFDSHCHYTDNRVDSSCHTSPTHTLKITKDPFRSGASNPRHPWRNLPLPFLPLSSPFSFHLPLALPHLEAGPIRSSYGDWGSAVSSPTGSGVWSGAPAEIEFGAFYPSNITSGGNCFNCFLENQLTKFKLCPPTSLFLSPKDFCDAFCVAGGAVGRPRYRHIQIYGKI